MLGGTIGCSADTVLTDAKRNILLNLLIPAALTRLSALLSVESVTSNIIVPTSVCSQFPRPASFSTTGVGGTDFVVLLAAAPISGGAVAWASYCALDNGGRPVVGRVNFNPAFIVWSDTDTTVQEQGIRAVMHEMCHALGFSVTLFLANPASGTIRDKPAQFIETPQVVAEYQIYTNCPSIRGPEVEDQGTAGTPGSHWERRNLRDDLMAGIITTGRVSRTTLAVFQDSGLYSVNFANAESMTWGLGTGCDFLTQKCNTPASGVGTYWCNSAASVCNFDRSAFGPCMIGTYSSALPTYFQYFSNPNVGGTASLMDFCPIASDSTVCVNENVPASTNDLIFGSTISVESRCFDTNRLLSVGYTASTFPSQTCLKARCVGGTRIEVAVHNTGFIQCPLDGSAGVVSAPGYTGTITCPPAPVICDTTVNIVFGARGSTTTTNNFNSATALHAPMTLLGVCVAVGAVALGFVAL
jgi:leishmanolysin